MHEENDKKEMLVIILAKIYFFLLELFRILY